ncbi:T9SS type B sorting domain-containing protein [Flavobacterium jejuense]|uniref:T9SS type B sorting domain-containing protein n=1 Tax=Flavobacterium jejuense TaxID=1544455 RepID=A0ABX0IRG8_9FLAO|nr:T9SS type B sorting domain-containing protein [Flavobacterium jejuense]NHN26435.1 T9SS type B sorting domain-containing protein [Flavobacterium jejuense]
MKSLQFTLIFSLLFSFSIFSQGGASSCAELAANPEAYQSCATNIPFSNSVGQNGENFNTSCIGEPLHGPTWFFIRIQNSGSLNLQISQTNLSGNGTDVDFVLWGPFNNLTNICSQLNTSTEVDCSWSSASIENINIPNGVSGELYVMLIDNYSNVPGNITVTQLPGGSGSTNCDFLSLTKITNTDGSDITQTDYCKPASKDLTATIDVTNFSGSASNLRFSYTWYKDGVQIGTPVVDSNSSTNTINVNETGTYRVETTAYDITNPGVVQDSDISIDLNFHVIPDISIQNSNSVCLNTSPILNTTVVNTALLNPIVDVLSYQWYLNTNPISGQTNSSFTPTQPGDYHVVVSNNSCNDIQSNTIRIIANPNITIQDNQTICEGDSYTITSNNANSSINSNATYEWFKDGNSTGITTASYTVNSSNQAVNTTSTYYLVTTEQGICINRSNTISVTLNALPVINTTPILFEQCDYIPSTLDGVAEINLTSLYDVITNTTPGLTLYYYEDIGLTTPINNPTNYINTSSPFNQSIYVKAVNENTTPNCTSLGTSIINLQVNPTNLSNYPDTTPVCPEVNETYGFVNFDMQRILIKNTYFPSSNVIISFHDNTSDASTGLNGLTNTSQIPVGVTTIYARIISATTASCQSVGTFNVTVNNPPLQTVMNNANICLLDSFLLNTKDAEALTGQNPSVVTSYFESFNNAVSNTSPINKNTVLPLTLGTKTYYIRLFDTVTQCISIINFDLNVFPNPTITQPNPIKHCGDGTTEFDLEVRINDITDGNTNYQVSFYETLTDLNNGNSIANPTNYTSTTTTIYINVVDLSNNNCNATTTLDLEVLTQPGALSNPSPLETCNDSGFEVFDITTSETEMAGATPVTDISYRYYIDLNDALNNNTNYISNPTQFTNTIASLQTIYVRLNSKTNRDSETNIACFRILELDLYVRPYPENHLSNTAYIICVDQETNTITPVEIKTLLNTTDYTFVWFTGYNAIAGNEINGQNSNSFITSTAGEYSVFVTNVSNVAICSSVFNFTTENSLVPNSVSSNPSELIAFGIDNTITGSALPLSNDYLYSIDGIYWQESPLFTNVLPGQYILNARNKFGCGEVSTSFIIADFPSFFTPNGDGFNDTWNIKGSEALEVVTIYIFDRYGKLLKQIAPDSIGWDGTFNGKQLPSDDYWFKLIYTKDNITKEYKSHFTLKR